MENSPEIGHQQNKEAQKVSQLFDKFEKLDKVLPPHKSQDADMETFVEEQLAVTSAKALLDQILPGEGEEYFNAALVKPELVWGHTTEEVLRVAKEILFLKNAVGEDAFSGFVSVLEPHLLRKLSEFFVEEFPGPEFVSKLEKLSNQELHQTVQSAGQLMELLRPKSIDDLESIINDSIKDLSEQEKSFFWSDLESIEDLEKNDPSQERNPLFKLRRVFGKEFLEDAELGDFDEADYRIQKNLSAELPKSIHEEHLNHFKNSIINKKPEDFEMIVELAVQSETGSLMSEDETQFIKEAFEEITHWYHDENFFDRPSIDELPYDALNLKVYNARLKRNRQIRSFPALLKDKMVGSILSLTIEELKRLPTKRLSYSREAALLADKIDKLMEKALQLYTEVNDRGLPSIRAFAEYLAAEANKGEFHVGRDTLTSTFVASNAFRWGKLSGKERKELIKHVDISRTVLAKTPRATLKMFLEQENINQNMMGIDGGYSGTAPFAVLSALDRSISDQEADENIRLMASMNHARRFNPCRSFDEVVEWMEHLPKFTERAQRIIESPANEFKKYLVVSRSRPETEKLLAWVVQHAVWRGTIPRVMKEATEPSQEEQLKSSKEEIAALRQATEL